MSSDPPANHWGCEESNGITSGVGPSRSRLLRSAVTELSVTELVNMYKDDMDMLKQVLAAKAEEDKESIFLPHQPRRTAEEIRLTEEARLQYKLIDWERTHDPHLVHPPPSPPQPLLFNPVPSSFYDTRDPNQVTSARPESSSPSFAVPEVTMASSNHTSFAMLPMDFDTHSLDDQSSSSSAAAASLLSPSSSYSYFDLMSLPSARDAAAAITPIQETSEGHVIPADTPGLMNHSSSSTSKGKQPDTGAASASSSPLSTPDDKSLAHHRVMEALRAKLRRSQSAQHQQDLLRSTSPTTGILLLDLKSRKKNRKRSGSYLRKC
ncbi:uncharacterized protein BYT42DRAFT_614489 [Radiomyces spectabilis]|uniref:uncharacterized protein n=1 Tax=Radiomyces spectabilis TaxID=64574 RepID=UPI00221F672B|nr:uncharacterized protein BYT42DRAFT_614489 [Radiomyces spectabilis]KAI8377837.1 hypothetical protein BYT42DRAFT_614489 [Radiomyces spectabilis]